MPSDPSSISGLQQWSKNSTGITGTNPVTQWDDQSGNANHLIGVGGLTLASAAVNGKDGVLGNGTSGYFKCDALGAMFNGTNKPFTFFAAFQCIDPTTGSPANGLMSTGTSGGLGDTPTHDFFLRNTGAVYTYHTDRRDDASVEVSLDGGTTNNGWHYVSLMFDGVLGVIKVDGHLVVSGNQNAGMGNMTADRYSVMVHRKASIDDFFNGTFIETFLYNRALLVQEMYVAEVYLAGVLGLVYPPIRTEMFGRFRAAAGLSIGR